MYGNDSFSHGMMEDPGYVFNSDKLNRISRMYMGIHGYLSLVVCFFGIPTNFINISVLTRKHMSTPINCILTWMAVSDMLTMASYVPFAIHFYCRYNPGTLSAEKNSYVWMTFLLFHINFSSTTHTISIWLGVALAIFRYKHINSPAKGNITRMRRLIRTRVVVFIIYFGSSVLLIPNYVSNEMVPLSENSSIFILPDPKLGTPQVKPVVLINLFLYSVVAKLVPCVLMLIYGGLLLQTLNSKIRIKRRKMSTNVRVIQRPLDTSRTTVMLLTVIVLFLFTELPQGILILLSVVLRGFFDYVYIPLGDAMDIIALLNNSINFILYCTMSREFRRTLVKSVCRFGTQRPRHLLTDFSRDGTQTTWIGMK